MEFNQEALRNYPVFIHLFYYAVFKSLYIHLQQINTFVIEILHDGLKSTHLQRLDFANVVLDDFEAAMLALLKGLNPIFCPQRIRMKLELRRQRRITTEPEPQLMVRYLLQNARSRIKGVHVTAELVYDGQIE